MPNNYAFPLSEEKLSAYVVGYRPKGFVADIISPRVKVTSESAEIMVWPKGTKFKMTDTAISVRGVANEISNTWTKQKFALDSHALAEPISKQEIDESVKQGIDPRTTALDSLLLQIDMWREKQVLNQYEDKTNYGGNTAAGSDTWNKDGTDIRGQIDTAKQSMLVEPNTMVLSSKALMYLRNNKSIKDAISGIAGQATVDQIKALFEIDTIVVPKVKYDKAVEGKALDIGDMAGNFLSLVYLNPQPTTSNAMTFAMTLGLKKGQSNYDSDRVGTQGGVIQRAFDIRKEVIVGKDCGHIITDIYA